MAYRRAPQGTARLIGRAREQAALGAVIARMIDGSGGLVLISGEAGIGKTTLAEFMCHEAQNDDVIVLRGHCYDLTVTPPYGPWVDIANDHRPAVDSWPAPPAFIHDRAALDDLSGQEELFSQLWDYFTSLASVRPLILVLEDLQWADEPSIELLRFAGRRVAGHRIVLIATYRDEELSSTHALYRLVPVLVRESNAMRVRLNRFDRIDTGELIQHRYDLAGDDLERLLVYLQERAEGNPFFTDELLRSLEDESILRLEGDGWKLGDLNRVPLPSLVRQIVDARLRKFTDDTRWVLAFGAVIGETIPLELWRELAELSEEEFADHLRPAIEQHILMEGGSPDRLRFSHALIHATLYDSVVLPQRRLWHRAAAEAMMGMAQPEPTLIAEHFRRAGDQRAVEWLIRAGRRAQRLYAWRIAVECFEDALALLDGDDSRIDERGWICYRLGRVLCFKDPARSQYYLDEAIRLGETLGDELLSACALTERGNQHGLDGEYQQADLRMAEGLEAFDRLLEHPPVPVVGRPTPESLRRGMEELRGRRLILLAIVERYDEAMEQAKEILAQHAAAAPVDMLQTSSLGPESGIANVYPALGLCYAVLGEVEQSRAAFARARHLHRNPFALALTIDGEVVALTLPYLVDHPQLLERQAEESVRCLTNAVEAGIALEGIYSVAQAALNLLRGTDWAATEQAILRARSTHPDAVWRQHAHVFLGRFAQVRGDLERASSEVRAALPQGPASAPGDERAFTSVELVGLAAELALDAGDLPRALAWLHCHDRWLEHSGNIQGRARGELLWARHLQLGGDLGLARQHAERSLTFAGTPRQPLALLSAHRFLGQLDLNAGDVTSAESHLSDALELCDACVAQFERAQTLLVLARLESLTGNVEDARALLAELRAICVPLVAKPLLTAADELESSWNLAPARIAGPEGLTARELEVLRLVARGMTDAEVADRLFLSPRTIGSHLTSIYGKLGVRSRTEATRFAVEHNLA